MVEKDFWVECNVCRQQLKNWVGSTPCCGSIAFKVKEDGSVSDSFILYAATGKEEIKPIIING